MQRIRIDNISGVERVLIARTFFVLYTLLVTYLSLRQGDTGVGAHYDKVGHLLMYALFAILAVLLVRGGRALLGLLVGIVLYSVFLEFAQSFVPGREMSFLDMLANAAGVYFGWRILRLWPAR